VVVGSAPELGNSPHQEIYYENVAFTAGVLLLIKRSKKIDVRSKRPTGSISLTARGELFWGRAFFHDRGNARADKIAPK
jgi:hypothetical protein